MRCFTRVQWFQGISNQLVGVMAICLSVEFDQVSNFPILTLFKGVNPLLPVLLIFPTWTKLCMKRLRLHLEMKGLFVLW